jgi:hypothetical protein
MHEFRKPHLQTFADWAKRHITGDEKGEAQIFLDRLFIAFGRSGSLDVGGTAEMRIRKAKEDGGGTSFADYVWPQSPTAAQVEAVAEAGRLVHSVRADALTKVKGGLRAVYRTLELPGKNPLKDAHAKLDAAVLAAYGFDPRKDLLAQLLALNHEVAAKEKAGQSVTPPGMPPSYGDASRLVTEDCIRP